VARCQCHPIVTLLVAGEPQNVCRCVPLPRAASRLSRGCKRPSSLTRWNAGAHLGDLRMDARLEQPCEVNMPAGVGTEPGHAEGLRHDRDGLREIARPPEFAFDSREHEGVRCPAQAKRQTRFFLFQLVCAENARRLRRKIDRRRPAAVFTSLSRSPPAFVSSTVCRISTWPASKSRLRHRSASNSPRRMPVARVVNSGACSSRSMCRTAPTGSPS